MQLSVVIIARDEARHIGEALQSARGIAGELLVLLDDRTRDETAQIALAHGARVVREPWRGFAAQRNRALDVCQGEWVLFLDADERLSAELAAEIVQIADCRLPIDRSQSAIVGYWIPRHNLFFGQVVRGGGWYPDRQLRLLRRTQARYDETQLVHEVATLDGQAGALDGHLTHINIEQIGEFWRKQRSYAIQEAQTLFLAGRRARWRNQAGAPAREFLRRFVQLGGWRDGRLGLLLCGTLAFFELIKFVHLKALEPAFK
ncbi:MAG: glycosyltransferase family 2 protein [Roseiflexaceae bacterium]|nr:glycosyltransferase family 2 protein [Roseiflexaceae bacterium]